MFQKKRYPTLNAYNFHNFAGISMKFGSSLVQPVLRFVLKFYMNCLVTFEVIEFSVKFPKSEPVIFSHVVKFMKCAFLMKINDIVCFQNG